MTLSRPKLPGDIYHQQFHNLEHHDLSEHTRPMWYEMPEAAQAFAPKYNRGGSVISQLKNHNKRHETSLIPGVHIVGHLPIFHGKP